MSRQSMFNKSVHEQTLNNVEELHYKTDVAPKSFKSFLCALPLTDHTDTELCLSLLQSPLKPPEVQQQAIKDDWRLWEIH